MKVFCYQVLRISLLGILSPALWSAENVPPNVLIVLTDDQGYGDLSLHGNPYIKTPHMDRLGREGVRFDRFYVNSVCAPTRAALLTGRHAVRAGVHGVTRNREALRPGEVTFAESFQAAGYETGYFGKWHNGSQYPNIPTGKGFETFLGFTAGHINSYFNAVLMRGTEEEATRGYITDVLTNEAMTFIEANRNSPFLLYLNYNAPHNPYQVPDAYFDSVFAHGLNASAAGHLAMVKNIDDNIGRLFSHLKRMGVEKNTIVVFLSDNGSAGSPARYYNAGMRGWKTSTHEGGTRVPFFIRWPAAEWEPHVVEELAEHVDFLPTLLDLAGIKRIAGPPIDGTSMRPLIEGSSGEWPERILFTHNGIDEANRYPGAVRTSQYRLVNRIKGPQAGSQALNRDETRSEWMLFDLINDPSESTDISDTHPKKVQRLGALYEEWVDDIHAEGLRRWPLPVGYDEQNPVRLHASQAYFKSPVHYAVGGFAHDWLTAWKDEFGEVSFEIDVAEAGVYDVAIAFTCRSEDAGSMITVSAGGSSVSAEIHAFAVTEIDLPNRDQMSNERYRNRKWGILNFGRLELPKGISMIRINAESIPGDEAMDFKHLSLFRRQ